MHNADPHHDLVDTRVPLGLELGDARAAALDNVPNLLPDGIAHLFNGIKAGHLVADGRLARRQVLGALA